MWLSTFHLHYRNFKLFTDSRINVVEIEINDVKLTDELFQAETFSVHSLKHDYDYNHAMYSSCVALVRNSPHCH